jgi:cell division protein FtsB
MVVMGVVIIILLVLIGFNLERLTSNVHSTNQYLNDISEKLNMILENQKKNTD